MVIIKAPTSQNCCNVLQMVHTVVPSGWAMPNEQAKFTRDYGNKVSQHLEKLIQTTALCLEKQTDCQGPAIFRIFLWHQIIAILWNKTVNQERREVNKFPWKDWRFEIGRFVLSLQPSQFLYLQNEDDFPPALVPTGLIWGPSNIDMKTTSIPDFLQLLLLPITMSLYMTFSAVSLIPLTHYQYLAIWKSEQLFNIDLFPAIC